MAHGVYGRRSVTVCRMLFHRHRDVHVYPQTIWRQAVEHCDTSIFADGTVSDPECSADPRPLLNSASKPASRSFLLDFLPQCARVLTSTPVFPLPQKLRASCADTSVAVVRLAGRPHKYRNPSSVYRMSCSASHFRYKTASDYPQAV